MSTPPRQERPPRGEAVVRNCIRCDQLRLSRPIAASAAGGSVAGEAVGDVAEDFAFLVEGEEAGAVAIIDLDGVDVLTPALGDIDVGDATAWGFAIDRVFDAGGEIFVAERLWTPVLGDLLAGVGEFAFVEDRAVGEDLDHVDLAAAIIDIGLVDDVVAIAISDDVIGLLAGGFAKERGADGAWDLIPFNFLRVGDRGGDTFRLSRIMPRARGLILLGVAIITRRILAIGGDIGLTDVFD